MTMTSVLVSRIRGDWDTHVRAEIDQEHLDGLAAIAAQVAAENRKAAKAGKPSKPHFLTPPILFQDSDRNLWPGDGRYRIAALRQAGIGATECEVIPGTSHDALWYAAGHNREMSKALSTDDKQKALLLILQDEVLVDCHSNVEIADQVGCDEGTVRNWKRKLAAATDASEIPSQDDDADDPMSPIDPSVRRIAKVVCGLEKLRRPAVALGDEYSVGLELLDAALTWWQDQQQPDEVEAGQRAAA